MDFKEIDLMDLSKHIFSNPIKRPNSYFITFDNIDMCHLFESLCYMLSIGCDNIYKSNENKNSLVDLDIEDFNNLSRYFLSFGMKIYLEITEKLPDNFKKYDELQINSSTKLTELKYYIFNQRYFIVYFDYYR